MKTCKTCGAQIIWARTQAGTPIPIDTQASVAGKFILVDVAPDRVEAHPAPDCFVGLRFDTHFATCPDADEHRKPRQGDLFGDG